MTRRFYKEASVGEDFAVLLDGRPLKTPGKNAFALPTRALAEACAAEWEAQGETVHPETMPLTRLANVAIDRTGPVRDDMIAFIAKYGETDLLCHRADAPASLAKRQAEIWDPLVAWGAEVLGAPLACAAGVMALDQPEASLAALAKAASGLDDFRLTGAAHATGLAGSAVIALAMASGRLTGRQAYEAACLDDLFQLEIWGEDEEARIRLDNLAVEFGAVERWFAALG